MRIFDYLMWPLALALFGPVWLLHSPYLLDLRGLFFLGLPVLILIAAAVLLWSRGVWSAAPGVIMLIAVATGIYIEASRTHQRERVDAADPKLVRMLGRHIVLGYRDVDRLEAMLRDKGLAGFFISGYSVDGRGAEELTAEIARLQRAGAEPGRPLLVSADQEGGPVSRLSPPLEYQKPLQEEIDADDPEGTAARVRAYSRKQAAGLVRLGVNVNFAPVVDLKKSYDNLLDFHTKIADRALHERPEIVASAATVYAREMHAAGVLTTLKHFPGLGRVPEDTHHFDAEVDAASGALEDSDWLPFRRVARDTGAMIMLGHVKVRALDERYAASHSEKVVRVLRDEWRHTGLLITDDMCMNPVVQSPGGVGGAAVRALNAGVDLLLISYHPERYYEVMDALLEAHAAGRLDQERLAESQLRIAKARSRLARGTAGIQAGGAP